MLLYPRITRVRSLKKVVPRKIPKHIASATKILNHWSSLFPWRAIFLKLLNHSINIASASALQKNLNKLQSSSQTAPTFRVAKRETFTQLFNSSANLGGFRIGKQPSRAEMRHLRNGENLPWKRRRNAIVPNPRRTVKSLKASSVRSSAERFARKLLPRNCSPRDQ